MKHEVGPDFLLTPRSEYCSGLKGKVSLKESWVFIHFPPIHFRLDEEVNRSGKDSSYRDRGTGQGELPSSDTCSRIVIWI